MYGDLADSLTNSIAVKTFASEKLEFKNLQKHTEKYRQTYLKDIGFMSTEGSVRVFIMTTIQVVTVGYLIYLLSHNHIELSVAIFVLAYLQQINTQIFTIGRILQSFDNALLDASPMTEILLSADQIKDKKGARKIEVTEGLIEFNNLSYVYDGKKELALSDIDLVIKPGQKIGLVGKSGSGKTTLVNLLLRFFDPTIGEIRIDGQNIADIKQGSLREQIAFVPQEPLLFHRSLRENIAYGRPNASEKEIINAAKRANAWEFIKKLPDGLDTLVGERGIKLSGGQRQRIAIARAILKDAPILLLDEATSALDSESEKLIQDSLEHLMHQRTSIVIAHRLSTIAKLDRIIVLKDGKVIEDGTHRQLIKNGKTYARLWKHQSGGFIDTVD
jgi:ATP-binding cassette subfamily B protein